MGGGETNQKLTEVSNNLSSPNNDNSQKTVIQSNDSNSTNTLQLSNIKANNNVATLADNKVQATDTNSQQQQQNEAKINSFEWNMGDAKNANPENTKLSVYDAKRLGFKFNITLNANQINRAQTVHLFRINLGSNNNGRTTYWAENNDSTLYYQSKYLGTIKAVPHYINNPDFAWPIADYVDYQLNITHPITNAIGEQKINIDDKWTGTINYNSPYSFRGVKESIVSLNFVGNGLNQTNHIIFTYPKINDNLISHTYMGTHKNSAHSQSASNLGDNGYTTDAWKIDWPGRDNDNNILNYNNSNGKQGDVNLNANLQLANHVFTTNGNKLIPTLKIGDKAKVFISSFAMPTSNLNKENYQEVITDLPDYYLPNTITRANDNLTLSQLKALNIKGIVFSVQEDGSYIEYVNIPIKDLQVPTKLDSKIKNTSADRSYVINGIAKNDTEANQMASNSLDNFTNGPQHRVPTNLWMTGVSYHLNDSQEKTTIQSDQLDVNTGNVIQSDTQTNFQNKFTKEGQAQVNIHYISGLNGTELSKTIQNVGDNNTVVNFSIPSIDKMVVRTGKDGQNKVQLLNGKTMTLPDNATTISSNKGLVYPAESTVKDYYVVLDPAAANETYNFVDDTAGGTTVGTPTVIHGYEGQTLPLSLTVPESYELAKGQTVPTSAALNNGVVLIHLTHKSLATTRDVTVKRTINYLDKATNKPLASSVTESVTFKQNGVQDLATSKVIWQNTDPQEFEAVDSPNIEGYKTPSQVTVAAQTVNVGDKDSTVNVYYSKPEAKITITDNQDHTPTTTPSKTPDKAPEQKETSTVNNNKETTPQVNSGATVQLPTVTAQNLQNNSKSNLAQTNTNSSENGVVGLAMAGGMVMLGFASVSKKKEF